MTQLFILAVLLCAVAALSAFGTRKMIDWAYRRNMLDTPNHRSSHTQPTARGGGVALVAAFYAGTVAAWAAGLVEARTVALLCCGLPIAIVGYVDDARSLSARTRLVVHAGAAAAALYALGPLPELAVAGQALPAPLRAALMLFGLVWLTNLYNFMDGIDGIAGGQALAAGLLWGLAPGAAGVPALVFAAAAAGFLRYNAPPARIFMGDAGSGFCGFIAGVLVLHQAQATGTSPLLWLIPLSLFFCDATVTLITRVLRGQRASQAHRSHAYQRLARRAGRHLPVSAGYFAATLVMLGALFLWAAQHPAERAGWAFLAGAAVPALLAVWLGAGREDAAGAVPRDNSSMNILILSHFAGSPEHGMVFRNYAMAREWVRQGHNVTIVASGYSHVRQHQPALKGRLGVQTIDGVHYIWVWGPRYAQSGQLGRVASMAAYTVQCLWLRLPLQAHYDVVIASSPHPFTIYPAAKLARQFKARLVFDIRDLWPLTPIHLGNASPSHPFIKLLQAAEDYACRHADLVTAVPHNAEPYLRSRGLAPGRFLAVGNGALHDDSPAVPLPETHLVLLRRLRESGAFILGYAGTLGTANAMNTAVDALARTDQHVHLVMMGEGACQAALLQQAQRLGCHDRVHFLAPVTRRQVADFLAQIDVAYVGVRASPLYAYGASLTKLNDYMLASVPILYSAGDNNNPVEAAGAGICCPPDDPAAIAQAINHMHGIPEERLRAMGEAGRHWCLANHMVENQVQQILQTLQHLPKRGLSS